MGGSAGKSERAHGDLAALDASIHRPTMDHSRAERPWFLAAVSAAGRVLGKWRRSRGAWLAMSFLSVPLLWLFAPALSGDRILAMRDAQHYYVPLWHWLQKQHAAGRETAWNPHENTGTSLLADPTAALSYPGRLVFFLPCSFETSYHLFLSLHLALAAVGVHQAARRLGCSHPGAALAAASYTYGGAVLFLYSNPIYLVGAAWLPWGAAAGFETAARLRREGRWHIPWKLALILALMIVGGDPQMAVHLCLLAFVAAMAGRVGGRATAEEQPAVSWRERVRTRARAVFVVGLAALAAGALAAIQILPTLESMPLAERRKGEAATYDFSVGPWRWCETVWPNAGGRMYPQHRRWMSQLPAEGRIWTPTLYGGSLVALLGVAAVIGGVRTDRRIAGAAAVALAAALAACGRYGAGWAIAELRYWFTGATPDYESQWDAPVGGLYWLLVQVLPGYDAFRYPAKWWTFVAFALALLGAFGWDAVVAGCGSGSRTRATTGTRRAAFWLACVLLGLNAVLAALLLGGLPVQFATNLTPNDWFGPFDVSGAQRDAFTSLVCSSCSALLLLAAARFEKLPLRAAPLLLLGWNTVDLLAANSWLCQWQPTPWSTRQRESPGRAGESAAVPPEFRRAYRVTSSAWWPRRWAETSSTERLIETADWERATWFPKTNLLREQSVLSREDGWSAYDHRGLLGIAEDSGALASWLDALGVDAVVRPHDDESSAAAWQPEVVLRRTALARAWIVERAEADATGGGASSWRHVLYDGPTPRDFLRSVVVEGRETIGAADAPTPGNARAAETAGPAGRVTAVRAESNTRIVVDVDMRCPAWLVLQDAYAPGWHVDRLDLGTGERSELPLRRANRVMRAVYLPAGRQRIVWTYNPFSGRLGLGITCSSLGCAALAWLRRRLRGGASDQRGN
ncbi:MAG: hypothetical protein U0939_17405 [Pirellulales bacterium]